MKSIDWKLVPEKGNMVALTVPEITEDGDLYMADFKDVRILVFKKTGSYLGITKTRGIRLGKKQSLHMISGIWYVEEDLENQAKYENFTLSPDSISLQII